MEVHIEAATDRQQKDARQARRRRDDGLGRAGPAGLGQSSEVAARARRSR